MTLQTEHTRRALVAGAREFNRGRYFEAHEAFEEALDSLPDNVWDLFVGVIQIAVGYHKATQGLSSGAAGMLERGMEKVAPFPADAAGLDLGGLRERAAADAAALRAGTFDLERFRRHPPRLRFV
jgi:predicted metal-dependent hydrolase